MQRAANSWVEEQKVDASSISNDMPTACKPLRRPPSRRPSTAQRWQAKVKNVMSSVLGGSTSRSRHREAPVKRELEVKPARAVDQNARLVNAAEPKSLPRRGAATRVLRGSGDRTRLEALALVFERCAEADGASTSKRYTAKRLHREAARDVVRGVLSNPVFECDNDDERSRCDDICTVFDELASDEGLDFGQVMRWLQHWRTPSSSGERDLQKRDGHQPVSAKSARYRPHAFNEAEIEGGSDDEPEAWSRCELEAAGGFLRVIASGNECLIFDLSVVDATLDARRQEVVLCPRGVGELLEPSDDAGVSTIDGERCHGRHPGTRLALDSRDELLELWAKLKQQGDDLGLAETAHAKPLDSWTAEPAKTPSVAILSQLLERVFSTVTVEDEPKHSSSLIDSLGIVDALARAVVRPPRRRAPLKALGPRIFEVEVWRAADNSVVSETWCRVDFVLKNRSGLDLQCAYWAPAKDAAATTDQASPCVVYAHGNSSCRAEALGVLRMCALAGVTLCSACTSGSGASDGEVVSLGLRESRDIVALCGRLRRDYGIVRLALWGRSMGAVAALLAAGERDVEVCCVIADSPFESLNALCTDLVDRSARAALGVGLSQNGVINASSSDDDEEDEAIISADAEDAPIALHPAPSPSDPHPRLKRLFPATVRKAGSRRHEARRRRRRDREADDCERLAYIVQVAAGRASAEATSPSRTPRRPQPKRTQDAVSFSPSAWLAARAAAAVEKPLADAVRRQIADRAGFDVRYLRSGRAAENLGFRNVPLLCVASEDDDITPLSHAEMLLERYVLGYTHKLRADRRLLSMDDDPPPIHLVVCRGDHNANRSLRVQLAILSMLATRVSAVEPAVLQNLIDHVEGRHSAASLREPPWADNPLARQLNSSRGHQASASDFATSYFHAASDPDFDYEYSDDGADILSGQHMGLKAAPHGP